MDGREKLIELINQTKYTPKDTKKRIKDVCLQSQNLLQMLDRPFVSVDIKTKNQYAKVKYNDFNKKIHRLYESVYVSDIVEYCPPTPKPSMYMIDDSSVIVIGYKERRGIINVDFIKLYTFNRPVTYDTVKRNTVVSKLR